jgi:hypothetical protein
MDYVFDWTILKYQQSVLAAPPDQALASGILVWENFLSFDCFMKIAWESLFDLIINSFSH